MSGTKRRNDKRHHGKASKRRDSKIASVQVENRYYTQKEYAKLTSAQKLALENMREKAMTRERMQRYHRTQ
jgi:hypothetical protein